VACRIADDTLIQLPDDPPQEGVVLTQLFNWGLVLWPFLSFGAIFAFDSPDQGRIDMLLRYALAYSIWFYPGTYCATRLAYHLLRLCCVRRWVSNLAWGLPVLVFFVLPIVLMRFGLIPRNPDMLKPIQPAVHRPSGSSPPATPEPTTDHYW